MGWQTVRKGLGMILLGHLLWLAIIAALVWMLVALDDVVRSISVIGSKVNWRDIIVYVAFSTLGLVSLVTYWIVLVGHWRCLYAPERKGAKWFMFACFTCVIVGPLLEIAGGFLGGMENVTRLKQGVDGFEQMRFNSLGAFLQIAGFFLGLGMFVSFLLFLRATAACFEDAGRKWNVNLYIGFTFLFVGAMIYLGATGADMLDNTRDLTASLKGEVDNLLNNHIALALGAGSLIALIWYLGLIVSIRGCIRDGLARSRRVFI
jgi:hypothetical protein